MSAIAHCPYPEVTQNKSRNWAEIGQKSGRKRTRSEGREDKKINLKRDDSNPRPCYFLVSSSIKAFCLLNTSAIHVALFESAILVNPTTDRGKVCPTEEKYGGDKLTRIVNLIGC